MFPLPNLFLPVSPPSFLVSVLVLALRFFHVRKQGSVRILYSATKVAKTLCITIKLVLNYRLRIMIMQNRKSKRRQKRTSSIVISDVVSYHLVMVQAMLHNIFTQNARSLIKWHATSNKTQAVLLSSLLMHTIIFSPFPSWGQIGVRGRVGGSWSQDEKWMGSMGGGGRCDTCFKKRLSLSSKESFICLAATVFVPLFWLSSCRGGGILCYWSFWKLSKSVFKTKTQFVCEVYIRLWSVYLFRRKVQLILYDSVAT
jgi:hypothetical protein